MKIEVTLIFMENKNQTNTIIKISFHYFILIEEIDCENDVTVVEDEDNEDSAPTMPSTVVMRLKSSLKVQCRVRARGELYAEWKKEDTVLQNSQKYVITSEDAVSSLTITTTGTSQS